MKGSNNITLQYNSNIRTNIQNNALVIFIKYNLFLILNVFLEINCKLIRLFYQVMSQSQILIIVIVTLIIMYDIALM